MDIVGVLVVLRSFKKIKTFLFCRGQNHCPTCRDIEGGREWRESLGKVFKLPGGIVDFECPEGFNWGDTPELTDTPKRLDVPEKVLIHSLIRCNFSVNTCCGELDGCTLSPGFDCNDPLREQCNIRDKIIDKETSNGSTD